MTDKKIQLRRLSFLTAFVIKILLVLSHNEKYLTPIKNPFHISMKGIKNAPIYRYTHSYPHTSQYNIPLSTTVSRTKEISPSSVIS